MRLIQRNFVIFHSFVIPSKLKYTRHLQPHEDKQKKSHLELSPMPCEGREGGIEERHESVYVQTNLIRFFVCEIGVKSKIANFEVGTGQTSYLK
jgi:putative Ca2+/H+ antiporter (TMEM165/GDT1 family)